MPATTLEDEARRVLPIVRSSFASILDAIPGRPKRPIDLTRKLEISNTLAWRIAQLVSGTDPYAVVQHVPGDAAVETFLNAARAQGTPESTITTAREAIRELNRLIREHAGDRASFEMMLAGLNQAAPQADAAARKAGFRVASQTWGIQAQTRLKAAIMYPGTQSGSVHFATISGFHQLRRLRPQTSWILARSTLLNDDGVSGRRFQTSPIDPEGALPDGFPLLRPFCSNPQPDVRRRRMPDNKVDDVLAPGPVGAHAATTVYSGEVLLDQPLRYRAPNNEFARFGTIVRTPVDVLVHDVLVHRDLYGPLAPEVELLSDLWGWPWETDGDANAIHELPCADRVEYLGRGLPSVQSNDVPCYHELMQYVCQKLGWDGDQLDVYRVRVPYPVISTAYAIRFPLPAAPAQP